MLDFLHMRTLIFFSGFTSLVLFVCMLYIWKRQKTYSGFLRWTFASLANAAGMILASQREILPDFFTVLIADILLMLSMMLITSGLTMFSGKKPLDKAYIAVLLIFTISFLSVMYLWPSFTLRVMIYSAIQAGLCLIAAYIVYKHLPQVFPDRSLFLFRFFIACSAFPILRMISAFLDPGESPELMTASFMHQAVVLAGLQIYMIVDIGLLILNAHRINFELNKAREEIKTLTGFIPICASCKKIRDDADAGGWKQLEDYMSEHIDVEFSHSICPECVKKLYPEFEDKI